jgi:hypothetical protein
MKTNKDQDNAPKVVQQKGNKQASTFKDERSETVAQGKLYDMVNRSQQVTQMQSLQRMVDNRVQNAPFDPIQRKENNTGLPDNLKSGVENLSGHSMDDVKVHYNSSKPAQLQAHAYAQGTDIHVASGQEKHLPHEAWHVVQQKQGRVKPTMQMKRKVNVNDDSGLEREADVMGAKALLSNISVNSKINNRSENVVQNKLYDLVNNSERVAQLQPFQSMANNRVNSSGVIQMESRKDKIARIKLAQQGTDLGSSNTPLVAKESGEIYNEAAARRLQKIERIKQAQQGTDLGSSNTPFVVEANGVAHTSAGAKEKQTKEGLESEKYKGGNPLEFTQDTWGQVELMTGNLTDDFNNDVVKGEKKAAYEEATKKLLGGDLANETAAIGGILGVYSNYKTFTDEKSNKFQKAGALFGMGESGGTAVNKSLLDVEGYNDSQFGGNLQFGSALSGTIGSTLGAIGAYQKIKEGDDKLEGTLEALQSTAGAVKSGITTGYGGYQKFVNGKSMGESGLTGDWKASAGIAGATGALIGGGLSANNSYKSFKEGKKFEGSTHAASALKGGIDATNQGIKAVAGAGLSGGLQTATQVLGGTAGGIGAGIGAAQIIKGGYDIYKGGVLKGELKGMKGSKRTGKDGSDVELDNGLMDTLIKGQSDKQKSGAMTMVDGAAGVLTGVLAALTATGVLAPPALIIGMVVGIGLGSFKLYKYLKKSRKQRKIDVPIDAFLETTKGFDYSRFLTGDDIINYSDYKAIRLEDAKAQIEEAKKSKLEADSKQKKKGWFKKTFTKDDSKAAQKKVEMGEQKYGKYSNMSEEEMEGEIENLRGTYDESTFAKKEKAYNEAQKALEMLEKLSGEDRKTLLKALGVNEKGLNTTKDKETKEKRDTTDAEKTEILAKNLMKILTT